MPTTYADRLARQLRRVARDTCDLPDRLARLLRNASGLILVQQALLQNRDREIRRLKRKLAVAREDLHQLRRTNGHLRRRVSRPLIVTEEKFNGWPECGGK